MADRSDAAENASLRRLTPQEKAVRSFFVDDRLVSIPAKPSTRELLFPVIVERCFSEDREYEEKEVNMRLALLHPDVAALRRYLVDTGWMARDRGIYRRGPKAQAAAKRPPGGDAPAQPARARPGD